MNRWIFPITIVVVLIVGIAIYSNRQSSNEAETAAAPAPSNGRVPFRMEQQWLIKLKMALAEPQEMPRQIYSTGRVVPTPSNHAVVAPPVNGIVDSRVLPRIGQRVTRGQVLATLIQTPTAAEAAQIHIENSRVDAERRRLAQAEMETRARLSVAVNEAERAQRLFEKKAYSQRQLEVAQADRKAAEANLASVQEQLDALKTAPMTANYDVVAPISGTISDVKKATGEEVHAGEPMMEIVALDKVWVEAPVFEKDLGALSKNVEGVFTTATFPGKEFRGTLVNISPVIDPQTRAAKAVFEVNNAAGELRVGMQANMRLGAGERQHVLLVPKESVLDNEGKKIVYVLISGEEFERRDVVVGDEYGGKVAILSGVKPGERVVTQGAYQLKLQELQPANAGAHTHEV
jgi:membrane fusion protein, heavy metal efflux system